MNFLSSKWLLGCAAVATTLGASAQQTIAVSKPADAPAEKNKSHTSLFSYHADDFNAPTAEANNDAPDLPAPRPQAMNNSASVREALDRRKNWTLLTPEQIFGVQTPEDILGPKNKPEAKKLSLEEQFLLRDDQAGSKPAAIGRLNNFLGHMPDGGNAADLPNGVAADNSFRQATQKTDSHSPFFSQFFNAPSSVAGPNENSQSIWNSGFSQPMAPKANADQLAAMERFRALMEPSTPPDKASAPTRFSVPTATTPNPFLQAMPTVNPAGHGISPLGNAFSRPTGIQPLPGISTLPPTPVATRPKWQAQLPPWMQSGAPTRNP
ncbi:MAG: hypothetical protein WCK57_03655 [Verrucomicrobiae bacterium]